MLQFMGFQLAPLLIDTASLHARHGHTQVQVYDMYFILPKSCTLMGMHIKDIMQNRLYNTKRIIPKHPSPNLHLKYKYFSLLMYQVTLEYALS